MQTGEHTAKIPLKNSVVAAGLTIISITAPMYVNSLASLRLTFAAKTDQSQPRSSKPHAGLVTLLV
jgi:hypothetical protein